MQYRLLFSAVFALVLVSGARAAWDWQAVTSRDGKLSCLMPGKPTVSQTPVPTPVGPAQVHQLTVVSKTIPGVFRVLYADAPGRFDPNVSAQARLAVGRDGEAEKYGARARDDREISLQGYPGRAYTLDMPKGWVTQYRNYLVGQRMYQIIAYVPKREENSAAVQKYLGSLKLLQ